MRRRKEKSRGRLFSGVRESVARHGSDEVTEAMDQVCAQLGPKKGTDERFVSAAARRILELTEW